METKFNEFSLVQLKEAYSIFCGVVQVRQSARQNLIKYNNLKEWSCHFDESNHEIIYNDTEVQYEKENYLSELKNIYYSGFVDCLFPKYESTDSHAFEVQCCTKYLDQELNLEGITIVVKYLDLFFFPENLLIFCFKCDFSGHTLNELTKFSYCIREMHFDKIAFLALVLKNNTIETTLARYKLRHFTVIEDFFDWNGRYQLEHLLYDVGTCSPIGTSLGEGAVSYGKPSEVYFRNLMNVHKISVFENWTALAIFDSFTMIHRGSIYNYNWESRYFRLLYVHSLFVKSYLIIIANKFLFQEDNLENLKSDFHEFNKSFNFKQISHNFLPQIIYDKIRSGLNIENEFSEIKYAIEQDFQHRQEKRQNEESLNEKRINRALFIVAILAVFTSVWDGSEWFYAVITGERGRLFNAFSVSGLGLIYLCIIYFLRKRISKK